MLCQEQQLQQQFLPSTYFFLSFILFFFGGKRVVHFAARFSKFCLGQKRDSWEWGQGRYVFFLFFLFWVLSASMSTSLTYSPLLLWTFFPHTKIGSAIMFCFVAKKSIKGVNKKVNYWKVLIGNELIFICEKSCFTNERLLFRYHPAIVSCVKSITWETTTKKGSKTKKKKRRKRTFGNRGSHSLRRRRRRRGWSHCSPRRRRHRRRRRKKDNWINGGERKKGERAVFCAPLRNCRSNPASLTIQSLPFPNLVAEKEAWKEFFLFLAERAFHFSAFSQI